MASSLTSPDPPAPGAAPDAALAATARVAAAIARLPTVAVRDWCDRAAAALAHLMTDAFTVALLVRLSDNGEITETEAVGVASGRSLPLEAKPGTNGHHPPPREYLEEVRCAGATLRRLGWTPPAEIPSDGMCGLLSRLPGPPWSGDGLPHIWNPERGMDLVCALLPMAPPDSRRRLALYVGAPARDASGGVGGGGGVGGRGDGGIAEWQAGVVGACLPLLGRAAQAALGGATKDRWISRREQTVLECLAAGKSVVEIAAELKRSPHTIHDHIKSLHRKLPARTRSELLARALGMMPLGAASPAEPLDEQPTPPSAPGAVLEPPPGSTL